MQLPALHETFGVPSLEEQNAAMEYKETHQHPVWSNSETMLKEFDVRLKTLLERSDLDKDGYISKEEFHNMVLEHFRFVNSMKDGETLTSQDEKTCNKIAKKSFERADKNNDGKLNPREMTSFFREEIESASIYEHLGQFLM